MQRVLVVGGYGAFGGLAAERLARMAGIEVIVAGRSGEKAQAFAAGLARRARARPTITAKGEIPPPRAVLRWPAH